MAVCAVIINSTFSGLSMALSGVVSTLTTWLSRLRYILGLLCDTRNPVRCDLLLRGLLEGPLGGGLRRRFVVVCTSRDMVVCSGP